MTFPSPADKVDLTSAASGYVTLTVPTPGIVGTLTDLNRRIRQRGGQLPGVYRCRADHHR
jgi:hypothetical protein